MISPSACRERSAGSSPTASAPLTQQLLREPCGGDIGSAAFDIMCFGEALPRRGLDPRVVRAIAQIGRFCGEPVTAASCAAEAGLSSSRFLHLFKQETGISFRAFRAWKRARHLLHFANQDLNLAHLAQDIGYPDSTHFSHSIRRFYGLKPRAIFSGSRDLAIRIARIAHGRKKPDDARRMIAGRIPWEPRRDIARVPIHERQGRHHLRAERRADRPEAASRAGDAGGNGARGEGRLRRRRQHHAYPSAPAGAGQGTSAVLGGRASPARSSRRSARPARASSSITPRAQSGPDYKGALDCVRETKPEMAACNAGSLNYLKVKADNTWAWPPMMFDNSVEKVQDYLDVMKQADTIPEFECFDVGIVRCVGMYRQTGMYSGPLEYNFVMGVASGMPADPELLPILLEAESAGCALAGHRDRAGRNLAAASALRRSRRPSAHRAGRYVLSAPTAPR